MQARTAIHAATGPVREAQLLPQDDRLSAPGRTAAAAPGVKPAGTHAQRPTQHPNRIDGLLRRDERERHSLCRAKKAVAFFRMSRSMRQLLILARNRSNSLRSSSVSRLDRRRTRRVDPRCSVRRVTPSSRNRRHRRVDCCTQRHRFRFKLWAEPRRRRRAIVDSSAHCAPTEVSTKTDQLQEGTKDQGRTKHQGPGTKDLSPTA